MRDLGLVGQQSPWDGRAQKIVIECKVLRHGQERTLREGLAQTRAYMDRCAADEGHLVNFDRREGKSWAEKVHRRTESEDGPKLPVWGI